MADPNPEIAVCCRGLTMHYGSGDGSVTALRGVDLDVRKGELLMLVGPSGCGKTTLISIITAILDQDAGSCEVLGQDIHRMAESDRAFPWRIHRVRFSGIQSAARPFGTGKCLCATFAEGRPPRRSRGTGP